MLDLENVPIRNMEFNETIDIPENIYKNAPILGVDKVDLSFKIERDLEQNDYLTLVADGKLILEDARSLKPIKYPFHIDIDELIDSSNDEISDFLKNNQNILDIMGVLWENIVLEIPISYTEAEELDLPVLEDAGDKEDIDPRLAPLLEAKRKE